MYSVKSEVSENSTLRTGRAFLVSTLIMLVAVFVIMLFFRSLTDPSEGRYAETPREMVASGQWQEMRLFGFRYYEKPPLAYWMIAPAIALFGVNDWATRVPLFVNAVFMIGLFYVFLRKQWNSSDSFLSILIASSTVGVIGGLCVLLTDPFLSLWFGITCACIYWGFKPDATHKRRAVFLVCAALAAYFGFITKGAPSFVLPGGIAFVWLLWEKRLSAIITPGLPLAAFLFLGLLTPTLWFIEQYNPGFFYHFVYEEHIARFVGVREMQLHAEPPWFYVYVIPAMLIPWSFFIFRAIRMVIINRALSVKSNAGFPQSNDSLSRFLFVWAFVVVGFFSISTGKMMTYIIPAIFPITILLARWGLLPERKNDKTDAWLWKLGVIGSLIPAVAIAVMWFFSFFDVLQDEEYRVTGISVFTLIPMAAVFVILILKKAFSGLPGLLLLNAGTLLSFALMITPVTGVNFNAKMKAGSVFYKQIADILKPDDVVVVLWDYRPSLPFYLNRPVILFQEKNELKYGMDLEPEFKGQYIDTVEELQELVNKVNKTNGRVFALIEPKFIENRFEPMGIGHIPAPVQKHPNTVTLQLMPSDI